MELVSLIGQELRIIKYSNEKKKIHITETIKRYVGCNITKFTMKLILKLIKL